MALAHRRAGAVALAQISFFAPDQPPLSPPPPNKNLTQNPTANFKRVFETLPVRIWTVVHAEVNGEGAADP